MLIFKFVQLFTCCLGGVATPKPLKCQAGNWTFFLRPLQFLSAMSCSFRWTGLAHLLLNLSQAILHLLMGNSDNLILQ